jgi:Virulence protein RhuM family
MSNGELILYTTEDGKTSIQLKAQEETVWLTQIEIADLFQTTKQNISLHIKNILSTNELPESVVKDNLTTAADGKRYKTKLYNLSLILAIGYRVESLRGIQFRRWATTHLQEYLIKGFVMDDARLKEPGGRDYFDEWLERIREIRASEKRFYQKVRDIYATAVDYDAKSDQAHMRYKTEVECLSHPTNWRWREALAAGEAPVLPGWRCPHPNRRCVGGDPGRSVFRNEKHRLDSPTQAKLLACSPPKKTGLLPGLYFFLEVERCIQNFSLGESS